MMAAQRPLRFVQYGIDAAPRASGEPSARIARQHRRIAAPVQKNQTLLLALDRKSTRLNSSHQIISYAVFCLKKKKKTKKKESAVKKKPKQEGTTTKRNT